MDGEDMVGRYSLHYTKESREVLVQLCMQTILLH